MLSVDAIAAEDLDEWQNYVDRHTMARAMHHAAWYGVLADAFSVDRYFLMARDAQGRVRGIFPLYFSRSAFTGRHLASLDDGLLADDAAAASALMSAALELRERLRAKYLLLRTADSTLPLAAPSITRTTVRRVIDTSIPPEALFESLSSYARRDIRRAEKRGYRIVDDRTLAQLDAAFYDEYAMQMHHLGTPVMGRDALTAMKVHLRPEHLQLYLVEYEGAIVGGMLCVTASSSWTALYAAVRRKGALDYANHLLYWHAIGEASRAGIAELDLGRNTPGSGVQQFKHKWPGEDRYAQHLYFVAPHAAAPQLADLYAGRTLKQRLWTKLPLAVANLLGPMLRKPLPFG